MKKELLDFILHYYAGMRSHSVILAYKGEITYQLTKSFAVVAENRINKENDPVAVQKNVYHVLVESLQYIDHHSDHESDSGNHNLLLLTYTDENYHVIAGNLVDPDSIAALKKHLDIINECSEERLEKIYRDELDKRRTDAGSGPGVTFIDIRRKTGRRLEYHFLPVNDQLVFFLIDSVIPRNKYSHPE